MPGEIALSNITIKALLSSKEFYYIHILHENLLDKKNCYIYNKCMIHLKHSEGIYVFCKRYCKDEDLKLMHRVCSGKVGIRPELDGLYIKPNIPDSWNSFTYNRFF